MDQFSNYSTMEMMREKNAEEIRKDQEKAAIDVNKHYIINNLDFNKTCALMQRRDEGYDNRERRRNARKRVSRRLVRDDHGRIECVTSNPVDGDTVDMLIDRPNLHLRRYVARDVARYQEIFKFSWGEKDDYESDFFACTELTEKKLMRMLARSGIPVLMEAKELPILILAYLCHPGELKLVEIPRCIGFCRKIDGSWWPYNLKADETYLGILEREAK